MKFVFFLKKHFKKQKVEFGVVHRFKISDKFLFLYHPFYQILLL